MPEDKRPPKKWWDNCIDACHKHEIADDCSAFCGWLWYHGEEEGSPFREARDAFFHKQEDACVGEIISLSEMRLPRSLSEIEVENLGRLLEILSNIAYYCEYSGDAERVSEALERIDDMAIDGLLATLKECSEEESAQICALSTAGEIYGEIVRRIERILGI